jgi:HPt (histidine-containing phosphotransfer) domain-containing protein
MQPYFLEDAETYIKNIKAGLAAGDAAAISTAAHTLKSSSFQLGADQLGGLAKQIEETARSSKNMEEISALAALLDEAFPQTSRAIKNL